MCWARVHHNLDSTGLLMGGVAPELPYGKYTTTAYCGSNIISCLSARE